MRARNFAWLALGAVLMVRTATAAPADDRLQQTLHKLDVAAAKFQSTAAEFQFDSYQTDPVPDKDTQKGVIYYERKGKSFQMAAHIREANGRPAAKTYTMTGGVFRLLDEKLNQVTTFARASKFESYLMLGFGASGHDLSDKWEIKDLGQETLDGIKVEKLDLVARDAEVRKSLPKVTLWMDLERGLSIKQVFDEGAGQSRVSVYFNIKMNQPLPSDAFALKTNSKTAYENH